MSQGAQAIDRAANILSLVVRAEDPVSYSEVVQLTGLARSTVSRLLQALERNGLLERDHQGRYRGGALFASYAARFDRVETLINSADSSMRRIGDETGETVNLAVASGTEVVHIAQVDSTFVLGATNWVDVQVPPHCSALGKVLYAYGAIQVPDGPLEAKTPYTLTSRDTLLSALTRVRESGYAITRQEYEEGLDAVAAPVRAGHRQVIAALGISGPSVRIADRHRGFGELLVEESRKLSRQLHTH